MASGEVAKLWVFLGLRTDLSNSVAKEIQGVNRQLAGTRKVADTLVNAGKTLAVGVTLPIVAAGAAMGKLASESVETENLFSVSVGNMKSQFTSFVNETSKALGINRYELMQTSGMLNVMLTSMGFTSQKAYDMSTAITKLAYDMASFYNLPVDEAIQKLQSGLAGEVEPLRKLGIMVDEATVKSFAYANGIAETGKELTANQKVLARYGVIMQATAKAQGDLARTADSPANALRRLQQMTAQAGAELGKIFVPAIGAVAQGLAGLVSGIANANAGVQGFAIGVAGFAAALGPVIAGIGLWQKGLTTLAPALKAVSEVMKISQNALLGWIGVAALATGVIVGIVNAVKKHNEQMAINRDRTRELTAQLTEIRDKMAQTNITQRERNALQANERSILDELGKILPQNIGQRDELGRLISVSADDLKRYNDELDHNEQRHKEAAKAALENRIAELEYRRSILTGDIRVATGDTSGDIAATSLPKNKQAEFEALERQIAAARAEYAKFETDVTDPGSDPDPDPTDVPVVGPVITALDRLKRELEIVQAENQLFRVEMGLEQNTTEQTTREYDAQAKIVAELTKQYNALAKAKGLAADATRDTYLELKKEQAALAEIKAQLEEERRSQMEAQVNAAASGGKMIEAMRIAMFGSVGAYEAAVRERARATGTDLSVAGAMIDAEAMPEWQRRGFKMQRSAPVINLYGPDKAEVFEWVHEALGMP